MSQNSKMKQDFWAYLTPELMIDIFSRLPIRSIIRCKCVCKSWLELLETCEFVNSHLSKSATGLAIFQSFIFGGPSPSKPYKFLEFVENSMPVVFNMSFPHEHQQIHSSVNGLLFLFDPNIRPRDYFICNPITRDYIKLPRPREYPLKCNVQLDTFGFGVSKKSGQYKVVGLSYTNETKCEVYTLGTGLWRSIEPNIPLRYDCDYSHAATFLNGNLHWRGRALRDDSVWISCFDLETERFTIFSVPPIHGLYPALSALEGCLVFCDNSYEDDERKEIVIWFMNKYGDDKSWTKKFIITKSWYHFIGDLCPIKVFEDGDILIAEDCRSRVLCYSSKTQTIEATDLAEFCGFDHISVVSYTPSFVPLNTFC
ncbi:hypothetical protein C2S53_016943 [Perilla frutescens var. hirtella]|uniref:F-box domain-containing protein n=1 Tax=Perilla frutescens var. hirtella TaxID=608512 RepID=A0AAD4P690_PERFH|nr:hypothetical protein C2S53_016943 [Perilla frutescens var. hirtella]